MIAELFREEERGYMVKFVNCVNLIEVLKTGEKAVIQKPEQIKRLKDIIVDYNKGALDYDNLDLIVIDAGAGGLPRSRRMEQSMAIKRIELLENP